MQDECPGMNWRDARTIFDEKSTPHAQRKALKWYLRKPQDFDPYDGYLSMDELCQQGGLAVNDLNKLEVARLLLPDTKDGRYRPKLAGWGRKLSYLLGVGWTIEEIQAWAKNRWKTQNPRQWPPERGI